MNQSVVSLIRPWSISPWWSTFLSVVSHKGLARQTKSCLLLRTQMWSPHMTEYDYAEELILMQSPVNARTKNSGLGNARFSGSAIGWMVLCVVCSIKTSLYGVPYSAQIL